MGDLGGLEGGEGSKGEIMDIWDRLYFFFWKECEKFSVILFVGGLFCLHYFEVHG